MPESRLALALRVLRLTLGIFFLQWGIEKFVVPATTLAIFRNFYGIDFGSWAPPLLGTAQVLIAIALLLHGVTVIVSVPRILSPWNPVSNHFFIAGVSILAAFFALYLLRDWDRYRVGRVTRAA
ncbi:hypothetical protein [Sediminicoccus sp. BL-A-41-H5]|uniref:hypothetical protein n=1 Tax=Sediminicoccus sp. BL-A-41-H5 TaxID=3421106 RepID=UPI003D66DDA2